MACTGVRWNSLFLTTPNAKFVAGRTLLKSKKYKRQRNPVQEKNEKSFVNHNNQNKVSTAAAIDGSSIQAEFLECGVLLKVVAVSCIGNKRRARDDTNALRYLPRVRLPPSTAAT